MLANQTVAALVGIVIPLALDRFGVDPAIASSIFVTAMTDATGFFAFLASRPGCSCERVARRRRSPINPAP